MGNIGTVTSGFVVVATLARPVGGWLADRYGGGATVFSIALAVVFPCAVVVSFQPVMPLATVGFLTMAAALGVGNGAVFALLGRAVPMRMVVSATGVVGACGGLGEFLPSIVMGLIYQATDTYVIGLMLLACVALGAFIYCWFVLRQRPPESAEASHDEIRYGRAAQRRAARAGQAPAVRRDVGRPAQPHKSGGRDGDVFYRDRWSHDKVVRSTHGVNCTGSCSWKVYVKDGIIAAAHVHTIKEYGPDRVADPDRVLRRARGAVLPRLRQALHGSAVPRHPRRTRRRVRAGPVPDRRRPRRHRRND